jgi:hypothetical protein
VSARIASCFAAIAAAGMALAHDNVTTKITWSREVSRIVYQRCASCHREGGAVFSLMTYQDARPWAKAIKEEVLSRRMPPWNAVKGFGEFRNDRGLTQEDLEIITEWVEGGAPEGDPQLLPPKPKPAELEPAPRTRRIPVSGSYTVKQSIETVGVDAPESGLQMTAHLPDGRVVPLLWTQPFGSRYSGPYLFRRPLRLPPGSRIEISPPQSRAVLLTPAPKRAR